MDLYEFEQLDADQKAIALLSADLLAAVSTTDTITQLYSIGLLYVKMHFNKLTCEITSINIIRNIDELLPFVPLMQTV